MAGAKSRNKGQRGEREFITLLQGVVDEVFGEGIYELKRNLFQTREGGCDVSGLPEHLDFISFEVKRQETLNLNAWWCQAMSQVKKNQQPIVAYKQNRKPWKVLMMAVLPNHGTSKLGVWCRAEITLADFFSWYKEALKYKKATMEDKTKRQCVSKPNIKTSCGGQNETF